MHVLFATLTIAFVVAVLVLVAFVLFTLSPFARHTIAITNPASGRTAHGSTDADSASPKPSGWRPEFRLQTRH
jgi:hypothetical protein